MRASCTFNACLNGFSRSVLEEGDAWRRSRQFAGKRWGTVLADGPHAPVTAPEQQGVSCPDVQFFVLSCHTETSRANHRCILAGSGVCCPVRGRRSTKQRLPTCQTSAASKCRAGTNCVRAASLISKERDPSVSIGQRVDRQQLMRQRLVEVLAAVDWCWERVARIGE